MFPIREKRFDYVEVGRFSFSEIAKNIAKRASGATYAKKLWERRKKPKSSS